MTYIKGKKDSPKLKACMAEIKKIIEKHDVGAYVVLADGDGAGEFLFALEPSFSMFKEMMGGDRGWFKAYTKSEPIKTARTVNMFMVIKDLCAIGFQKTDIVIDQLKNVMHIEGNP